MSELGERLLELRRRARHRSLRHIAGPQGPCVTLDGQPVLLLCSNNYLGLAGDPRVRRAAADAALELGAGAGASRLVSGTMDIHSALERRLAAFTGKEGCILFGSGYLANVGVLGALAGPGETIYSDELNHASIIDGARLSRARVDVYRHRDMEHLDRLLRVDGPGLIVSDSVFSMDGDLAPLREIVELAHTHGARTVIDEAHALGALGPGGRGAVAASDLTDRVDVIVGTLGKALGSYGAYVCASAETVDYLINCARPLIYSTAPAPPAVAAGLEALTILEHDRGLPELLGDRARTLRAGLAGEGFPVSHGDMHITPLIVGPDERAMALSEAALARGVFAQGIRPPSVPAGTARLRLTVTAAHEQEGLREAAHTLAQAARDVGIEPEQL